MAARLATRRGEHRWLERVIFRTDEVMTILRGRGCMPYCGSSQEAVPPPVEAVGEPAAIDGPQARDVIVDIVQVQRN